MFETQTPAPNYTELDPSVLDQWSEQVFAWEGQGLDGVPVSADDFLKLVGLIDAEALNPLEAGGIDAAAKRAIEHETLTGQSASMPVSYLKSLVKAASNSGANSPNQFVS
ncbi:MAG: hypothetical protein ACREHG_09095 [Candidatus Saccharimonadales bacterium]